MPSRPDHGTGGGGGVFCSTRSARKGFGSKGCARAGAAAGTDRTASALSRACVGPCRPSASHDSHRYTVGHTEYECRYPAISADPAQ